MAPGAARVTRTWRLLAIWGRLYGLTSGSLAADQSHAPSDRGSVYRPSTGTCCDTRNQPDGEVRLARPDADGADQWHEPVLDDTPASDFLNRVRSSILAGGITLEAGDA
jgi:hypothetical protein